MDETFDRLRAAYNAAGGWVIDWTTPNAINARIGKAFTRRELVPLLAEYTAVFLKGCPAP